MFKKLLKIQSDLKAPKSQHNAFGNYDYRSCEDILEAVKPLLAEQELLLTIRDELVSIDGWYYIESTVTLTDGTAKIETSALARETETRPKFDSAQLTGSASSYARKYALNGLFLIDDNKDPDTTNGNDKPKAKLPPTAPKTPTNKTFIPTPKPLWISSTEHKTIEGLINRKLGKDGREKIREAIGNIRKIHPADKEFADIHLNEITDAEYKAITDELNKREDI